MSEPRVVTSSTGNCNYAYITNLGNFQENQMHLVLSQLLTNASVDTWGRPLAPANAIPTYKEPTYGMLLFAQGSDHPISGKPYSMWLRNYLEAQELGHVWSSGPVPNFLHSNQPGYLFVWTINRTACKNWWTKNVWSPYLEAKKAKEAAAAALTAEVNNKTTQGSNS